MMLQGWVFFARNIIADLKNIHPCSFANILVIF